MDGVPSHRYGNPSVDRLSGPTNYRFPSLVCAIPSKYVGVMYWNNPIVAELADEFGEIEAEGAQLRSRQLVIVSELDRAQAPQTDGSRSLLEWVQSRFDIKRDTARDHVFSAGRFARHRGLHNRMLAGRATFDRTIAAVKLADAGAPAGVVGELHGRDLAGVRRLIAQTRLLTRVDERAVFNDRFFTIQPNLDESRYRMWGEAPGTVGRTIDKAICGRADQLHDVAGELPSPRGRRQLDAFAAMAQDSLEGDTPQGSASGHVTVFVDAREDDLTERTAEIEYGPRVGPDVLEQMLCGGRVQVVGLDEHGIPVTSSPAARAIPPAIRHAVSYRDGACVIDGCSSRYRLEPHHIVRFADVGDDHPSNLVTLCWYHHHVAVHASGYRIDPESPPLRRRLVRGTPAGRSPPWHSGTLK
jgi:diadenosine tetraphosphatase ApaH/serine/threonine PP2A family protein phosphatase